MGKEEKAQNAPYVADLLGLMEDAIRVGRMNEPHLKILKVFFSCFIVARIKTAGY